MNLFAQIAFNDGQPDINFSPLVVRCPANSLCRRFRLENGWYRLRSPRHMVLAPIELGCIERGHLHHCHANLATVMQQFAAQCVSESSNRKFCTAIGRLKRNCTISESGPNLDDNAMIMLFHTLEGGHRAVNRPEIGDFGSPLVIFGGDLLNGE